MKTFTFIVGPVAAGKSTFMENKLYNLHKDECNFFDHDKAKLMVQLYAKDKSKVNDLNLGSALKNAMNDCIVNNKDFMMQIHFTADQLPQINSYLHEYKNQFVFHAHFIGVSDVEILRSRANKRELLGGHSSQGKSIEKSFRESFRNFIGYLPKFEKATFWDNSKEFGFISMEPQMIFEHSALTYQNSEATSYALEMLSKIKDFTPK